MPPLPSPQIEDLYINIKLKITNLYRVAPNKVRRVHRYKLI